MPTQNLKTNPIIVAELYDLTFKRLWFKNYDAEIYEWNLTAIYNQVKKDVRDFLGTCDPDYKPITQKYRIELKLLVEDLHK